MADNTHIEWADATWNVWTGCTRVSEGCTRCYAERLAATRMKHLPQYAPATDEHGRWTRVITIHEPAWDLPLRWTRPRRIFVNAQSDTFHEAAPPWALLKLFCIMESTPRHTFMVLTKRADRMRKYLWSTLAAEARRHIWLGVTVESADYLNRVDELRDTPAAIRFLSIEPLLGPIPNLNLEGIHAVIVGGESGPGARPMHPDWARDVRDQCAAAGIAFFFKQWGEWAEQDGRQRSREQSYIGAPHRPVVFERVGKRAAGRILDGRTHDDLPGGAQ